MAVVVISLLCCAFLSVNANAASSYQYLTVGSGSCSGAYDGYNISNPIHCYGDNRFYADLEYRIKLDSQINNYNINLAYFGYFVTRCNFRLKFFMSSADWILDDLVLQDVIGAENYEFNQGSISKTYSTNNGFRYCTFTCTGWKFRRYLNNDYNDSSESSVITLKFRLYLSYTNYTESAPDQVSRVYSLYNDSGFFTDTNSSNIAYCLKSEVSDINIYNAIRDYTNSFLYDDSGVSDNINNSVGDLGNTEDSARQVMESIAVVDQDHLDTVRELSFDSAFDFSGNAFTWWKHLINDILSYEHLGAVAVGVILAMFLSFASYLLMRS